MTYVVDERCIKCKTTDCVSVCPVNCFYEGENMLVIHPDECIDCGVCVPECPVDAIKPDTEPDLEKWLELNREFAQKWPNITAKKDMPKDARAYWDETGKFDKYFSAKPGEATEHVHWHFCDIHAARFDVWFWTLFGHRRMSLACRLMTQSGRFTLSTGDRFGGVRFAS